MKTKKLKYLQDGMFTLSQEILEDGVISSNCSCGSSFLEWGQSLKHLKDHSKPMKTRKAEQIEKELLAEGFITGKDIETYGHITKPQHTPTPWFVGTREDTAIVDANGYVLYRGNPAFSKSDITYIVRAVNSHEELLDLIKKIARRACHAQYVGKKCICFSCLANDLIAHTEGK